MEESSTPYGYVYVARNLLNGKVYVGQTTQPVAKRWIQHRSGAANQPKYRFGRALAKYGHDAFSLEVRSTATSQRALDMAERFYIELYDATNPDHGYNLLTGGSNGKHTEQSRQAMSLSRKGRTFAPEWVEKLRVAGLGRKHSAESIAKMSRAQKGRTFSDETRKRMSEAAKKRVHPPHSEDTKAKIRESNRLRRSRCNGNPQ